MPSRAERIPSVTTSLLEPLGSASRWFELYSHSTEPLHWTAKIKSADAGWLKITKSTGFLQPEDEATRVSVFVADWSLVPHSYNDEVLVEIRSDQGDFEYVHVPVIKRQAPPVGFTGSVESDRHVSMSATNFDKKNSNTLRHKQVHRSNGRRRRPVGTTTHRPKHTRLPELFVFYVHPCGRSNGDSLLHHDVQH